MTNEEQVNLLKQGVEGWNKWREENPDAEVDLSGSSLREADLEEANLDGANLTKVNLWRANLIDTDLSHANLRYA